MKSEGASKQRTAQKRRIYKTKDDFLRWLRQQDTLKQQAAEEQVNQAASAASLALMVWADEGGAVGQWHNSVNQLDKNISQRRNNHEQGSEEQ